MKPTAKSWMDREHYLRALDNPWYKTLLHIQDRLTQAAMRYFADRGLRVMLAPITTHSVSSPMGLGSDSLPVKVDLFGVDTYLSDSMQFMLEYGCRLHSPGCYYLMPSFRGESADATHLCQFYHMEAEIVGGIEDVISLVEGYIRFVTGEIMVHCAPQIRAVAGDLSHLIGVVESTEPFHQVTMDEASRLLEGDPTMVRVLESGARALTRTGERELIRRFGGFVWLTEQDHLAVPFYQAYADPDGRRAKAADLLFGLGEVVGSGERHVTAEQVYRALELHGVEAAPYDWYCRMRERRPLQTAGFGLGTERFICWLLQHDDVRDCQLFPRFNGQPVIP